MSNTEYAHRVGGHKIYKRNNRVLELERREYKLFVQTITSAMSAAAAFSPEVDGDYKKLRSLLDSSYQLCAKYASKAFGREEIQAELLSGLQIGGFDFSNGCFTINFIHSYMNKNINYSLIVHNFMAPYKENWAELYEKNGGWSKDKTIAVLSLI